MIFQQFVGDEYFLNSLKRPNGSHDHKQWLSLASNNRVVSLNAGTYLNRGFSEVNCGLPRELTDWHFDWACVLFTLGPGAFSAAATCQPAVVGGPLVVLTCLFVFCGGTADAILHHCLRNV